MSEARIAVPFVTLSPDPEVSEKAQRRKFSTEDKKRRLEDVDRAAGHGGIGAVLRREGIYSSTLHAWRKERDAAVHKAFSQKRESADSAESAAAMVHHRHAAHILAHRQVVLDAAFRSHPERFVRKPPQPPELPSNVWINRPPSEGNIP